MPESRDRKLEELRDSIRRGDFAEAQKLVGGSGSAERSDDSSCESAAEGAAPVPIDIACGGAEAVRATLRGRRRYWLIRRQLRDALPEEAPVEREYHQVLRGARQHFDELEASVALCVASDARPEDLLFLDIETCGLEESAQVFLVGMMFSEGGELVFEQYLARDGGEEAAILSAFDERYATASLLVSFNGRKFDLPMLRGRAKSLRLEPPWQEATHLDLLVECRSRWRGRMRRFSLQSLEGRLFGRRRRGDIAGRAIPLVYRRFTETGDAAGLAGVLRHNLLDLVTMAQLLCALLTGCEMDNGE